MTETYNIIGSKALAQEACADLRDRKEAGCDFNSLPLRSCMTLAAFITADAKLGGGGIATNDVERLVGISERELESLYRSLAVTIDPEEIRDGSLAPGKSRHWVFSRDVRHVANGWNDHRDSADLLNVLRARLQALDKGLLNLWFESCAIDAMTFFLLEASKVSLQLHSETTVRMRSALKLGCQTTPLSKVWSACRVVIKRAITDNDQTKIHDHLAQILSKHRAGKLQVRALPRPKDHVASPVMKLFSECLSLDRDSTPESVAAQMVDVRKLGWITTFMESRFVERGELRDAVAPLLFSEGLPAFFVYLKGMIDIGVDLEDAIILSLENSKTARAIKENDQGE